MTAVVVTGSGGLIGSSTAAHFAALGLDVIGIDNDMRRYFFGPDGSTAWNVERLKQTLGAAYRHVDVDIRDRAGLAALFADIGADLDLVVHTAAQPSHDWAAKEPLTDFDVNAVGTINMLEVTRNHAPDAAFIYTSTNKVYGDTPNSLPLHEEETRWEIDPDHPFADGITEDMSIDRSLHSVFGAAKVAGDVMVQEYGRYFDMPTACFRGGTLSGPSHSAAELHGFLAYVMRCAMEDRLYRVFGYQGKQVRDAIHSDDVVRAFEAFWRAPRIGEVYNLGGGRTSNCSNREAFALAEEITGRPMRTEYVAENRVGDHIWWIGSNARFEEHYPGWQVTKDVPTIMREIHDANVDRWTP
ncbi:MAG: NAD-dependent epimerase/dehydratase family protein [Candidatus Nanopelagicales bacterium]